MRLYSFTNSYLSSLQHGLQTAHVVAELALKYPKGYNSKSIALYEWMDRHKTIIIKNGGNQSAMLELATYLVDERNPHPYAIFREDQESLGGVITAAGIVLPKNFYEFYWGGMTDWEYTFRQTYLDPARLAI